LIFTFLCADEKKKLTIVAEEEGAKADTAVHYSPFADAPGRGGHFCCNSLSHSGKRDRLHRQPSYEE
jgi:hypothetical protein